MTAPEVSMQAPCSRCGEALTFRLPHPVPVGARSVDVDYLIAEHECPTKRWFRIGWRRRR